MIPINSGDVARYVARYYAIFGAGSVYDWNLGQVGWAGQPVILVHDEQQLAQARSMFDNARGFVVTILMTR
jgi:hypothetical protein